MSTEAEDVATSARLGAITGNDASFNAQVWIPPGLKRAMDTVFSKKDEL